MFDIGFLELSIILVLSLLVLGPERLPKAAKSVGYWFGKARRYVDSMKSQVEAEFDTAEVKRLLHNQEVQIRELQTKLQKGSDDLLNDEAHEEYEPNPVNQELQHNEALAEKKTDYPQYDIVEEDDDEWDDLIESNPKKEQLPDSGINQSDIVTEEPPAAEGKTQ